MGICGQDVTEVVGICGQDVTEVAGGQDVTEVVGVCGWHQDATKQQVSVAWM